jgi:hypothetical protein
MDFDLQILQADIIPEITVQAVGFFGEDGTAITIIFDIPQHFAELRKVYLTREPGECVRSEAPERIDHLG